MCRAPKMPDPPPPPQPSKAPDVDMSKMRSKNRNGAMMGGSLLTGPSGLSAAPSTGRSTLLGA